MGTDNAEGKGIKTKALNSCNVQIKNMGAKRQIRSPYGAVELREIQESGIQMKTTRATVTKKVLVRSRLRFVT